LLGGGIFFYGYTYSIAKTQGKAYIFSCISALTTEKQTMFARKESNKTK
jgi:hypothetical protein